MLAICMLLISGVAHSAEVLWGAQQTLPLDAHMEFTVSEHGVLKEDEVWLSNAALLSRKPQQFLHFRTTIINSLNLDQSLWFIIPFPAIKHVTVTDGYNSWETGDAKPFTSRPITSPDYIFPVRLKAEGRTVLSGVMGGEILRYSFNLSTPEQASSAYRYSLSRDKFFFGTMMTLFVVCLIIYIATKYQAYLSFAVFTFAVTAWFYRIFGYGFENLWPNHPQFNDVSYGILLYFLMISASWMIISVLKRQDRTVQYKNLTIGFTGLLIILGIFSALFLDLNTTLLIPLYWFFPSLILTIFTIYQEHRAGSIKAKWFAFSLMPLTFGSAIVVMFGIGFTIGIDPIISMMIGIGSTCLLLTVMISTYLIKLLQSQRDTEQQQYQLKTQQAIELEKLVKERTQELEASNKLLQQLASIDPLTQLPNRRSLDLFVDEILTKDSFKIGIALLDLDHFKRVNDTFGHDVGDMVLIKVGELLQSLNSESCIAGRFGGEEFAIIMSQPNHAAFEECLKQLHHDLNQISLTKYPQLQVKACIGWLVCANEHSISDCFRRADEALYKAKEQGRNQLMSA